MVEMQIAEMGQYAHGNQPIQHMPYLYSYAGQPWKTQYWVRQIMNRLYNSTEKGFPGDEDQGGMSSWYILSALGIYAVTPGTEEYVLGSPVFRKATITMENGNKLSSRPTATTWTMYTLPTLHSTVIPTTRITSHTVTLPAAANSPSI